MQNGGWDKDWRMGQDTQAWDEWYEHIEHVIKVQNAYIDNLQVDLAKVKHEVRLLTATVSLLTNTVPNSISLSSAIPAPPSTPPWPLANSATTLDRQCQHGMIKEFKHAFTPNLFPDFHALHDGNDTCWGYLQSVAQKNDMQHCLLENSFKACHGLRIQRYGKKSQIVRFACTHCSRCTGEIEARKKDGNGGSVYSETLAEKSWFWRWLFSEMLKDESLQQATVHGNNFILAPAPPPPPLPRPEIQNLAPDIVAPLETIVEVPSQNPLEANMVEPLVSDDIVEVQPVFEAAPTSSQEGDNEWNNL